MPALFDQRRHRELAVAIGEQPHHLGFDGDVGLQGDGATAGRGDLRDDGVCGVAPDPVVDGDRVAASGGEAGGRAADATTAAGDEKDAMATPGDIAPA